MIRLKEVTTFQVNTGDSVVPAMAGFQPSKKHQVPTI